MLTRYPKDSKVEVFYDPGKPGTAVLEKGGSAKIGLLAGIAIILVSFVLGAVLM